MAFPTALCHRLLSLQRYSAFLAAHALKSSIQGIYLKQSSRKCNILSVSRCFLQRSPRKHTVKSVTKLRYIRHGLVLGLIPVGAYLLLDSANASTRSAKSDLCRLFPSWLNVCCQGVAVIKPSVQHQRQTVKQSIIKTASSIQKSLLLFVQFLKLCVTFGPLLVFYPLTLLSSRLYSVWLSALFYVVQISGPVYIKLGQWASTRRDLFSGEFCELFSQLHYNVKPHAWCHTERALCAAYGKQWYQVLKVDKTQKPLGSGCVAQVNNLDKFMCSLCKCKCGYAGDERAIVHTYSFSLPVSASVCLSFSL